MCKEGWCIGLGQVGVAWGRGTVWNTLKGGAAEKRGVETEILKKGSMLDQGVGALKRGDWNPLTKYGDYKTIQSKLSKYEQVEREVQILVILW